MAFEYEVYNAAGELLNEGETVLVFINMKNNRPTACPPNLLEKLKPFFEQE
jgi:acyl-CoA thioester hydrolase